MKKEFNLVFAFMFLFVLLLTFSCSNDPYPTVEAPKFEYDYINHTLSIKAQEGAIIFYYDNGKTPNEHTGYGSEYLEPFENSNGQITGKEYKAVAYIKGIGVSDVSSFSIEKTPLETPELIIEVDPDTLKTKYQLKLSGTYGPNVQICFKENGGETQVYDGTTRVVEESVELEYWAEAKDDPVYMSGLHAHQIIDKIKEFSSEDIADVYIGEMFLYDGKVIRVFNYDASKEHILAVHPNYIPGIIKDDYGNDNYDFEWGAYLKFIGSENSSDKKTKESLYMGYGNTDLAINTSYDIAKTPFIVGRDTIWKVLYENVLKSDSSKKWFIPSIDELKEIYEYKDKLGISSWRTTWSSSEYTSQSACTVLNTGGVQNNRNRTNNPASMFVCVDL